ncbi:MAG: ComF family protein [Ignavibacteriota bacterium]
MKADLDAKVSALKDLPSGTSILSSLTFVNEGIIQSIIHSFKYEEMPRLAKILGASVSSQISLTHERYDYLVPIPLHRTRLNERGYNQSEMVAQGMSRSLEVPVAMRGRLKRIRQTPSQTGLNIDEREANVRGAFGLSEKGRKEFQGKRLLIIDDVMTTGATLASAARTIMTANPQKIDLYALATVID